MNRRSILSLPAAWLTLRAAPRGQSFATQRRRYFDPSTENEVVRLTSPEHASLLPSRSGRCVSSRGNYLLYVSDQSGTPQVHRMDLKSGESRVLTEAGQLDASSVVLSPDERFFYFIDGDKVRQSPAGGARDREVAASRGGFTRGMGLQTEDGISGYTVEGERKLVQVRLMGAGAPVVLVESPEVITRVLPRPRRAMVAYHRGGEGWFLVTLDRRQSRMKLGPGATGAGQWSPDGRTFLYLTAPVAGEGGYQLREFEVEAGTDKLLGRTSQFVEFARNSDASVFLGASGSKASPLLLLLLRIGRREFPLCEHRSMDVRVTPPIFSPNSQRIFFQGERAFAADGEANKPTIAMVVVDRLVEKTELENTGG